MQTESLGALGALDQAARAGQSLPKARLREAAEEFEAVFLNAMLQPIFETVGEDAFGGGAGASTWRSLQVEEYAGAIADAGGIGVADQIERELIALQEGARAE